MTNGREAISGVDYFYEVQGDGEPLLLLHGGLLSTGSFAPALPSLAPGRRVIAVDLPGHGRTTLGDRPLRCEAIADDLRELLRRLGHDQADVLGYSFGGGVALRLAVQHPRAVRRLVLVSTVFADEGWYPDIRRQQKQIGAAIAPMMERAPLYATYRAIAPNPADFPRLLDAMGDFMRQAYDWSADVRRLNMPVFLIFGDADSIRPAHQIEFYELLGGGLGDAGWNRENMPRNRLAVVPDMTHYEAFAADRVARLARPFLDGRMATRSA
jgi:pimeloyl-ACP methyl ester carboxylesterase